VLSLPPAFVLSQDQTLKFETALRYSCEYRKMIALRTIDERSCTLGVATKASDFS
jgi:hypothetical protein